MYARLLLLFIVVVIVCCYCLLLLLLGCVLTTLQLLEAIDPVKGHDEILNLFDKLVIIDPYRKGYYNDLSKLTK